MEEKQEIKQIIVEEEDEQTNEEKANKEGKSNEIEEKVITVVEENPLILPDRDHTSIKHESVVAENVVADENLQQPPVPLQAVRVEEQKRKDSSRKPSLKSKCTVPQPFSLATEKRMLSRERRRSDSENINSSSTHHQRPGSGSLSRSGSVNFKDSQPQLSKSVSLNYRTRSVAGSGEASKPRHANSTVIFPATKTSCKIKVTTTEPAAADDNKIEKGLKTKHKIQVKEQLESRHLQVMMTTKKQPGKDFDKIKLGRSSTFKAPPLPKIPPSKPETKKMQATARPTKKQVRV